MHPYAQTNIQLFNQLRTEGYSNEDFVCAFNAYKLAIRLFTGFFRPSGKTFIAHLVGTASILGSLHASAELVAAGLIHAAYDEGDFGTATKGLTNTKREQVRRAAGEEVEEYVVRYALLQWNPKAIQVIHDRLDKLDSIDRDVLLMRLANQLEDHLDLGILYCANAEARREGITKHGYMIVEMADKLGFPALAAELDRVFRETVSGKIPAELYSGSNRNRSYLIAPRSYRRTLTATFCQKLASGLHNLRSTVDIRKRFRPFVRGLRRFM